MIEGKIVNAKEINEMLKSLDRQFQAQIYYKFNRKVAGVVARRLKQNAPVQSSKSRHKKSLKDSVVVTKNKKGNASAVSVGFKKKGYRVRFIEYGTSIRATKAGANRGYMTAKPFVQRSHDEAIPEVNKMVGEDYAKHMQKILKSEVKKINKKLAK
jgi:HK97 gp10 family phage protein